MVGQQRRDPGLSVLASEALPFVFLTALTDRDNELKGRRLGADDYISKPIDFYRLELIIQARLAGIARTKLKQVELKPVEIDLLTWVARGKTSAEIARKLRMSKRTVDFHIDNTRLKLKGQSSVRQPSKHSSPLCCTT
jgi:DNA-binding NarL/FixJ family response regulator